MDTQLKFWPAFLRIILVVVGSVLTAIDYLFLKLLIEEPSNFAFISFTVYTILTMTFIVLGVDGLRRIKIENDGVVVNFFLGLIKFKKQKIVSINKTVLSNRIGTYPSLVVELENGRKYQISDFETKNFHEIKAFLLKKYPLNTSLKTGDFNNFLLGVLIFIGTFICWMVISHIVGI